MLASIPVIESQIATLPTSSAFHMSVGQQTNPATRQQLLGLQVFVHSYCLELPQFFQLDHQFHKAYWGHTFWCPWQISAFLVHPN